jgi:hypothetical protein
MPTITKNSVVIQDLTYTEASFATPVFITYDNLLSVAGLEKASYDPATQTVHVSIKSGASTATQIAAAVNADYSSYARVGVIVSGTGSNPQTAVTNVAMTGAAGPDTRNYYQDQSTVALTASFVAITLPEKAQVIFLKNDDPSGTNLVIYSLDGVHTTGQLKATESIVLDDVNNVGNISLKYGGAAPAYRLTTIGG